MNHIKFSLSFFVFSILSIDLAFAEKPQADSHYTFLTAGKVTGHVIVKRPSQYQLNIDYEFNDRGRGPKILETIELNTDGIPIKQQISGHSYMNAQVDENYQYDGQTAQWKNTIEKGSKATTSAPYYIPADGSPENTAILARLLLKTPNKTLRVLPAGQLTIEKKHQLTVEQNKKQKAISLYAIYGLGLTPSYIWLDQHFNYFAQVGGWMSIIVKGWEQQQDKLYQQQQSIDRQIQEQLAIKLRHQLSELVVIKNCALFDSVNAQIRPKANVFIYRGKIAAIYHSPVTIPKEATVIDGEGKTLMPGLFDMHDHISGWKGILHLAAGVTSIRDMGNHHDQVIPLKDAFNQHTIIGPRIIQSGFIDKKGEYSAPVGILVDTLDEAIDAVHWYAQRGYPMIKLYSSIEPSWVKPLAKTARKLGMRVGGHIPAFMSAEQAIQAGYNEINHINMLFLNFLATSADDTRTPIRFTAVGERASKLDLNSKPVKRFIKLLKARNIVIDTTIVALAEDMFLNKAGEISPSYKMIAHRLPAPVQRSLLEGTLDINPDNEVKYQQAFTANLKLLKKLYDAKVTIVPGTDGFAGFTLHRELELYAKAGIPNAKVLQMATHTAAQVAAVDNQLGAIKPGMIADVILIDGNPVKNISNIRYVSHIIKGDVMYKSAELYQSIGISR